MPGPKVNCSNILISLEFFCSLKNTHFANAKHRFNKINIAITHGVSATYEDKTLDTLVTNRAHYDSLPLYG